MEKLEQYYKDFIKSIEAYRDMGDANIDKLNYLIKEGYKDESDLKQEYELYKKNREDTTDHLSYTDWKDEYADDHEDEITDWIYENNEALELQVYKNGMERSQGGMDDYKATITLGIGGPNIFVEVSSRFKNVTYGIYWGGDVYEQKCDYLFSTIEDIYNLELYSY